ncbi:MAG: hypothetical protein IJF36_04095 [Oscillibacter sp.]|nr:hypothetical protein [Oscillibacter sp.]
MKNKFMRAATLLMALTLMTSCFVGGTFAKYTTSSSGSDKARVAYWGFDAPATIDFDLFDAAYTNVVSRNTEEDAIDGYENVIAPGTSGDATFSFKYTSYQTDVIKAPEVAYTFEVDATMTGSYNALDANENFKWTLKKGTEAATEYNTVAELLAAIEALSGDTDGSMNYAAGALPDAFTNADEVYTVGWYWTYFVDNDGDVADTAMGNSQSLDNVNLTITITATQID